MTTGQMKIQILKAASTKLLGFLALFVLTAASVSSAQTLGKAPTLTVAAVPLVTAQRTQQTMVSLNFRIPAGYHINSNTPKSEFLIPTALKMDLPTDIILGKIEYPAGEEASFPFSPDEKLSVYSGDFTIGLGVHPLKSVVPGKYVMHGVLRYQACDNAACYPPKTLPVSFEVKVVKEPAEHKANPAQSPHVHN
ncbi:MAG TPA: protein-disulfide reductase DsbD domain-containing protein [Candidatus Eremiobacteraceae bacterium]|nr:protein-disulfide reductase DsbD domain-containing protein [Candidatus Eremiobacteraceae bacterium]